MNNETQNIEDEIRTLANELGLEIHDSVEVFIRQWMVIKVFNRPEELKEFLLKFKAGEFDHLSADDFGDRRERREFLNTLNSQKV